MGSDRPRLRVLVVDNYDSFVYNLVHYLAQLGADVTVRRNDDPAFADSAAALAGFDAVLVSPGPGTPESAGASVPVVEAAAASGTPLLGVCLGHQAIGVAFGGVVSRAPELLHGKTSEVEHGGAGVLAALPTPFIATRYHSLAIENAGLPEVLEVTASTPSGVIMAVRHRSLPIEGVQFHPESVLTEGGHRLIAAWLRGAGGDVPAELVAELDAQMTAMRESAFAVPTA